jgi:predicted ATPase
MVWPIAGSGFRAEQEEEAKNISELIKQVYEQLGYEVIAVPAMDVKERAELIIKNL